MNQSRLSESASRLELAVLTGILILAAALRLGAPGISEFKYDEAMISRRAIALAREGVWPASTLSSIPGIPQPPLKALLLAIPFAVTRNPAAAVAFQGALGVLAVGATYLLGKRYFGVRVGLIAATLLASAPWVIFYDRKLWPMTVSIFTLVMMLGIYAFVVERRPKAIVVSLIALGLLIGFYLADAILVGVVVLGLAFYPRSLIPSQRSTQRFRQVSWLIVGLVGLLIALMPYIVEFASGRADLSQAFRSDSGGGQRVFLPLEQIRFAAQIGTGYQFHALAGDKFRAYYETLPLPNLNNILDYGTVCLIVIAMIYILVQGVRIVARRHEDPPLWPDAPPGARYVLLALWIFVPIAAWTVSGLTPQLHRYVMAYPAPHLALAIMLVDVSDWVGVRWKRLKPIAVALVMCGVFALVAWQTVEYVGMLRFVATEHITGGHGRPVRELWAAAQQVRQLAGPDRLPIVVHTSGADPEHEGGPAEFDALLGDFHLYLIGDPHLEVTPAGKYIWVVDHDDGTYTIESRASPAQTHETGLARLANGVDLLLAEAGRPQPDRAMSITLIWHIWNVLPGSYDYGYTAQLYTEDGRRWGQVDGQFLRSMYWQIGDVVTISTAIPVAAAAPVTGRYHLLVAMYTYLPDTQQGVDVLDIAGNPAGQSITVPLDY